MGGATSVMNPADAALLTSELRKKLESYQQAEYSEDEIRDRLTKDYYEQVKALRGEDGKPAQTDSGAAKNSKNTGNTKSAATKREGLSGKFGGKSNAANTTSKNAKAPTRRRSFDAPPNAAGKKADDSTTALSQSLNTASSPALTTIGALVDPKNPTGAAAAGSENMPADSWDSVAQQPYCPICQMAFKSETFLDRHVKFSDLHINNVKKKEAQAKPAAEVKPKVEIEIPVPVVVSPVSPSGKLTAPKQVEGQHFKMLYTGSKFFWRTQESVDLHFYHHILPHVIEIICYDNLKSKEMPRLYLDYMTLFDIILAGGVLLNEQSSTNEEAQRTAITTYILQRLQLQSGLSSAAGDTIGISTSPSVVNFVKQTGDNYTRSPLLDKMPVVLIPVVVTRRRRTNAEEIDATISSLTNDRAALVAATGHAEKIANLVYSSASSLASKKWWAQFNPVRRRWIWAIRRVIRQKLVKETKQNLLDRAAAKAARSK